MVNLSYAHYWSDGRFLSQGVRERFTDSRCLYTGGLLPRQARYACAFSVGCHARTGGAREAEQQAHQGEQLPSRADSRLGHLEKRGTDWMEENFAAP